AQRRFSAAEPHVGHPVDELYGALEPALKQRRMASFLPALEELRQQVRLNPAAPDITKRLLRAQLAIASAARTVQGGDVMPEPLLLSVVRQLAQTAVEDYGTAIAGERIVDGIEYQDARGFLLEARRLLTKAIAERPTQSTALSSRQRTITAMLRAFPGVMPASTTSMSLAELQRALQGL
ncbi:MAG: hypothetical protein ACKOCM_04065, partial [Cyanobacteriota bacterium]